MRKLKSWHLLFLLAVFVLLFTSNCKKEDEPSFVHEYGSFTDTRDGHVYSTIEIGTQTWFAENLSYEGEGLEIMDVAEWENNAAFDGWCYYENNKASFGNTYGVLYQWELAKIACPAGWHLPSSAEWNILRDYLGGYSSTAGGKLKETGTAHWSSPNTGATNETGFTALPGGVRDHVFRDMNDNGYWWCSTEYNSGLAQGWSMSHNSSNLRDFNISFDFYDGLCIRCLKD